MTVGVQGRCVPTARRVQEGCRRFHPLSEGYAAGGREQRGHVSRGDRTQARAGSAGGGGRGGGGPPVEKGHPRGGSCRNLPAQAWRPGSEGGGVVPGLTGEVE